MNYGTVAPDPNLAKAQPECNIDRELLCYNVFYHQLDDCYITMFRGQEAGQEEESYIKVKWTLAAFDEATQESLEPTRMVRIKTDDKGFVSSFTYAEHTLADKSWVKFDFGSPDKLPSGSIFHTTT